MRGLLEEPNDGIALTLTTTGSSGASTYNPATGDLNIPIYSGGGGIDGTMVLNRIPYGFDADTLQTSANLTFNGTVLTVVGNGVINNSATGTIPLLITSTTASQTASLLEVQRYDASPGLTVSATTEVTLGGAYDYVNAKHASQHIVRYSSAGAYSGKGLKINDLSSGGIVRLHALSSNSIYFTNDTGSAVPITYGTWSNPNDGTSFSTASGQWYISSGKLGVNHIWWGYAQLEATSTSQPQIGAVYDINNYMTIQVASNGATTLNAIGTGAGFIFSDSLQINSSLQCDSIVNDTGLAAGTYTPTRSAETNLDYNVTMTEAQYMRVGNTITVSGRFTADPTTPATATSFEITLPVASNIGAVEDVAGVAFCGSVAGQGAEIIGVVANDTAKIQWVAGDVTSQSWSYQFTYQVI